LVSISLLGASFSKVRRILKRLAVYSQASPTEISMLCTFAFGAAALVLAQLVVAERIATSSGEIIGHRASNRPAVMEYLGIPFARSPTGELRFAPPVAFKNNGTITADTFVCSLGTVAPC
jgi:hypothetical protein